MFSGVGQQRTVVGTDRQQHQIGAHSIIVWRWPRFTFGCLLWEVFIHIPYVFVCSRVHECTYSSNRIGNIPYIEFCFVHPTCNPGFTVFRETFLCSFLFPESKILEAGLCAHCIYVPLTLNTSGRSALGHGHASFHFWWLELAKARFC